MRIALIGVFGPRQDEGMRKLCAQFAEMARTEHEVQLVGTREFGSGRAWPSLRTFRPEVLHYLTGPTVRSLLALRLHRLLLPGRPTVVATGLRPYLGRVGRWLLPAMAPDVYLAQARRWQRVFAAAGARTVDFPNGVDLARFRPAGRERRRELKTRWGLPADKPVVLHVGHIKENRNLDCLLDVQRSGRFQVWIIGSTSESRPGPWHDRLLAAGCRLDTRYQPAIEEAYQAADVYAFTVRATPQDRFPRHYREVGVIDHPLSVLEARACGLPVVTTRHDALVHFLGEAPGIRYFDGSGPDCLRQVEALLAAPGGSPAGPTPVSLEQVRQGLLQLYSALGRGAPS